MPELSTVGWTLLRYVRDEFVTSPRTRFGSVFLVCMFHSSGVLVVEASTLFFPRKHAREVPRGEPDIPRTLATTLRPLGSGCHVQPSRFLVSPLPLGSLLRSAPPLPLHTPHTLYYARRLHLPTSEGWDMLYWPGAQPRTGRDHSAPRTHTKTCA